jgi:CheY-like chemotaxis protein
MVKVSHRWQSRDGEVAQFAAESPAVIEVLVVDDTAEIRQYLRRLLEVHGYQVETACNGEEAVRLIAEGCSAAVVLLDMQMPGIDGLETLRSLRALRPDLQVIMCSGVDDPDQIQEAKLLGAQAYLVKPVQHLYLTAAVDRCFAIRPAAVARPAAHPVIMLQPSNFGRPN